jgi:hypothetical protein
MRAYPNWHVRNDLADKRESVDLSFHDAMRCIIGEPSVQ